MLGEDFPSDAELEATIERAQRKIDEADDYCGPAELAPSNNDLAHDLLVDLRAMLRQRQEAERNMSVRIAAAVMAERDACSELARTIVLPEGRNVHDAHGRMSASLEIGWAIYNRQPPCGADQLATQLAEAEARGLRRAAVLAARKRDHYLEATRSYEGGGRINRGAEAYGSTYTAGELHREILALIPRPPAGGDDDAG
ncbi:hypothetical protein [Pseudoroseomonas cervicalis]|uniref:hypothetical protein n=1 Tax=Teichococcus cervicalis TaxID=204525 RepID=UPI00277ED6BB|nr:hypothetical protein [Pseudoroseomonas cervicalis]MDQ1081412.1 hypothetical protein [Pseudoroseomonas cervicalis]